MVCAFPLSGGAGPGNLGWSSRSKRFPLVSLGILQTSFLGGGKDLNLRDSYLRSATTSKASLEGVDLTVPGVESEDPLLPAVDTNPASSGEEEPEMDREVRPN